MRPSPTFHHGPDTRRLSFPPVPAPVLALVLLSLLSAAVTAATVHVPADASTIATALAGAQPGDTVVVACGTYAESGLIMPPDVVLRGETGDPACVVVDGGYHGTLLTMEDAGPSTVVEGMTFRHGAAPGNGSVACMGGAPVLRHCRFTDNACGGDGGAFYCQASAPLLEDCDFTGNISTGGSGGAVASRQAQPVLRRCSFTDNVATGWGGALYASGEQVRLEKAVLTGNHAYYGGALAGNGSALVLVHATVTGNAADHSGGGTYLAFGATLDATRSDWSGNAAPEGKDVLVSGGCQATFHCCRIDPSTVAGGGPAIYDDAGCEVEARPMTWSGLKGIYR